MIIIDNNTIEIFNGKVTGKIFFKQNGLSFPDSDWDDFVVIILNWWIDELHDLYYGSIDECYLNFMDGPFKIKIEFIDDRSLKFDCIKGNLDKCCSVVIDEYFFVNTLYMDVNSLLRKIRSFNFNNEEIILLSKNLRKLSDLRKLILSK